MYTTPLITNTPGPSSVRADAAYRGPCRVCGAHITRVTRGGTEEIHCGEYCDGVCQLRKAALQSMAGPVPSGEVGLESARCVMLTA